MRPDRQRRREETIAKRKALRIALKDNALREEWTKRFQQGVDVGQQAERSMLLEKLHMDGHLTKEEVEKYAAI